MADIIPRADWCDLPPRKPVPQVVTPTPRLWLHHGASGTSDVTTACGYAKFHIRTHGWSDVGYSFLIADGHILEGRGAGHAGAHTQGDNFQSHGICMVGNWESRLPSTVDIDALVELVRHGMEQRWWRGPLTGGHRDAPGASTSCPGRRLWRHIPEINRQVEEGVTMTPEQEATLNAIYAELLTANDNDVPDGPTGRTLRDRVWQTNAAVGRLERADLADDVADRVVAALPAGTISARQVADAVADVLAARLGDA